MSLLLVHRLRPVRPAQHLIRLLGLHDRVPAYDHSCDLAGQCHALRAGEEFATEEPEEELGAEDVAGLAELEAG